MFHSIHVVLWDQTRRGGGYGKTQSGLFTETYLIVGYSQRRVAKRIRFFGLVKTPRWLFALSKMMKGYTGSDRQPLARLLMIVPVVFPTIEALGYDPIWFGIVTVLFCSIGNFTPPVGVSLFAMQVVRPD